MDLNPTVVLKIDGGYKALVEGKILGTYKTLEKAFKAMYKYAKGQGI